MHLLSSASRDRRIRRFRAPAIAAAVAAGLAVAGCGASGLAHPAKKGQIVAVGAENQYANVISQIGGRYVDVGAIESNPNTDPHTFEASPSIAKTVGAAQLVVQNGLGYDTYMNKIEQATPNSTRKVITVQHLLKLPDSTPNPHLWYSPRTMPAVATALVKDLSALEPAHRAYFAANAARFDASLKPWYQAMASFKRSYPHAPVATTEPVGDYMLEAAGTRNMTPWALQYDIMQGTDPAPQDVSLQNGLFTHHRVKVFVYNQQVTDSVTEQFESTATAHHIPVVGVYETMPLHYTYQRWMLDEVMALRAAVAHGVSTKKL
jgi:zinc/manganese transport system substrate-binding protein